MPCHGVPCHAAPCSAVLPPRANAPSTALPCPPPPRAVCCGAQRCCPQDARDSHVRRAHLPLPRRHPAQGRQLPGAHPRGGQAAAAVPGQRGGRGARIRHRRPRPVRQVGFGRGGGLQPGEQQPGWGSGMGSSVRGCQQCSGSTQPGAASHRPAPPCAPCSWGLRLLNFGREHYPQYTDERLEMIDASFLFEVRPGAAAGRRGDGGGLQPDGGGGTCCAPAQPALQA